MEELEELEVREDKILLAETQGVLQNLCLPQVLRSWVEAHTQVTALNTQHQVLGARAAVDAQRDLCQVVTEVCSVYPPGAQKGVSESDYGGIVELGRAVCENHGKVCLPAPCPLQTLWLHHRGSPPQHEGVECAEWIRGHEAGSEAIDDVGPALLVHATGQH